jgi:hypothetical protein
LQRPNQTILRKFPGSLWQAQSCFLTIEECLLNRQETGAGRALAV